MASTADGRDSAAVTAGLASAGRTRGTTISVFINFIHRISTFRSARRQLQLELGGNSLARKCMRTTFSKMTTMRKRRLLCTNGKTGRGNSALIPLEIS
jgi:hypothetical protein